MIFASLSQIIPKTNLATYFALCKTLNGTIGKPW